MKSSAKKIELASVDDLFSTEESRQDEQLEKIQEIPLSELHPFKDHPFKVKDDDAMIETADSIKKYTLSKEVNKKVYQLSGGEQQRVALARLMMKKCSVVLADEPTGSLDKKNRDIVMRLLHELNEEGKTVIIVTHDQGIIEDEPYVVKI